MQYIDSFYKINKNESFKYFAKSNQEKRSLQDILYLPCCPFYKLWKEVFAWRFIILSHTEVARGYRVCPIRKYVRNVRTYVRTFTFCHRSSAYICQWISI